MLIPTQQSTTFRDTMIWPCARVLSILRVVCMGLPVYGYNTDSTTVKGNGNLRLLTHFAHNIGILLHAYTGNCMEVTCQP